MTYHLSRRRFIAVSAASCALAGNTVSAEVPIARWSGAALGSKASLQISGIGAYDAAPIFTAIQREIRRLENVFSLYRRDSEISHLNRYGTLKAPSPDLLSVLETCSTLHDITDGAFDPTVQPAFVVSSKAAIGSHTVSTDDLKRVKSSIGWHGVRFDIDEVRLLDPDAALTLNGIAQGYITDQIAMFLREHQFVDVVVNMGEIVALGYRPDGMEWRIGVADPDGAILRQIALTDRALATSAPKGTVLDTTGRIGHIFNPLTGLEADGCSLVSVSAPTAVIADGLSTALCVLPRHHHADVLNRIPDCQIELVI